MELLFVTENENEKPERNEMAQLEKKQKNGLNCVEIKVFSYFTLDELFDAIPKL